MRRYRASFSVTGILLTRKKNKKSRRKKEWENERKKWKKRKNPLKLPKKRVTIFLMTMACGRSSCSSQTNGVFAISGSCRFFHLLSNSTRTLDQNFFFEEVYATAPPFSMPLSSRGTALFFFFSRVFIADECNIMSHCTRIQSGFTIFPNNFAARCTVF